MPTPSATATAQVVASHNEMVISWWRDWTAFLALRQELLVLTERQIAGDEPEEPAPVFDTAQPRPRRTESMIRADLERIPANRRSVFETTLAARIDQVQRLLPPAEAEAVDHLALEREVIAVLKGEAFGEIGAHIGIASTPTDEGVFDFPADALQQVPDPATYAATATAPARGRLPRSRLLALVIVLPLIWVGIYFLLIWQPSQPVAEAAVPPQPAVMLNDVAVLPWSIRSVIIGDTAIPVAQVDEAGWPTAPAATAGWRTARIWPVEMCIPADMAPTLPASIQLVGANGALDRTVTLTTEVDARADLRLVQCGDGAVLGAGVLAESTPQALYLPGEPHDIPHLGSLTLTGVRVATAVQDVTVAPGRARIQIALAAPDGVDWPAWLPILRFGDGGEARHTTVVSSAGGVTINYDVDIARLDASRALWQLTDPDGSGAAARWLLHLQMATP